MFVESVPPHFPGDHMIALDSSTRPQWGSQGSYYDMIMDTKCARESPPRDSGDVECFFHGKVNLLLLGNNRVNIDMKTAAGETLMY